MMTKAISACPGRTTTSRPPPMMTRRPSSTIFRDDSDMTFKIDIQDESHLPFQSPSLARGSVAAAIACWFALWPRASRAHHQDGAHRFQSDDRRKDARPPYAQQ